MRLEQSDIPETDRAAFEAWRAHRGERVRHPVYVWLHSLSEEERHEWRQAVAAAAAQDRDRAARAARAAHREAMRDRAPCPHDVPGGDVPMSDGWMLCPSCRHSTTSTAAAPAGRDGCGQCDGSPGYWVETEHGVERCPTCWQTGDVDSSKSPVDGTNAGSQYNTIPDAGKGLLEVLRGDSGTCGACAACGTTDRVAVRDDGLVVPTPVCDACWISIATVVA